MIRKLKSYIGKRSPIRLGYHYCKAFLAAAVYGFPARKLHIIGITGTDGKTTTVGMTDHILQNCGKKSAALSTAFRKIGEDMQWNTTQKTSPSPFYVQKFLQECVRSGCEHVVLEYSSHGLVQHRVDFTWPSIAAITHISPEHLDYHGTMQQYIADKKLLFTMLGSKGVKILNADDETFSSYKNVTSNSTHTWSTKEDGDYRITDIQTDATSVRATVVQDTNSYNVEIGVPGGFNIQNGLVAALCASECDIALDAALAALKDFTGLPGRMERIDEGQPFSVYVDFTVTPGAYETTLSTLREMIEPDNRILVLTGSCGDRMKEKRPLVGEVCGRLADIVIVTNEDPYTEDPQKIIDEVWQGIDQNACEAVQIFDRREAIEELFSKAKAGDAVILCAKGADTTMWVAEGQIPWNEREIAREILRAQSWEK